MMSITPTRLYAQTKEIQLLLNLKTIVTNYVYFEIVTQIASKIILE